MSFKPNFNSNTFLSMVHRLAKRAKGPSEKKRLQRRLDERRQKKGLPPLPQKPSTDAPKKPVSFLDIPVPTRDERRVRAAKRRRAKINRKLRERQRLAARSGLPELGRRQKWQATRRQPAARACCAEDDVVTAKHRSVILAAEELIEVSHDARQNTTFSDDSVPWSG